MGASHRTEPTPTLDTQRKVVPGAFTARSLNWARLHDLRQLWRMRSGCQEGFREVSLFWCLNFLLGAEPTKTAHIWKEAQFLASELAPGQAFYQQSDLSTIYRRAQAALRGEVVEFRGYAYPVFYTPKSSYLIDVFQIAPDEERHMTTIVSQAEKYRQYIVKRL